MWPLAVLKSRAEGGQTIGGEINIDWYVLFKLFFQGAMITTYHNPRPEIGMKLVDPRGEMLEAT